MPIPGQPPPSPVLRRALAFLAAGKAEEGEALVTAAAKAAKKEYGSKSHPLARAYADMARFHVRTGRHGRAGAEFKHACDYPMPADPAGRADRLAFMFGYAACLDALGTPADAEKVLRQCAAFARSLHGPATAGYAAAIEPLAAHLLRTGRAEVAARLADEAYDLLWRFGDRAIAVLVPTRAEAMRAAGRGGDPFADLDQLPAELMAEAVANVLARAGTGDGPRVRQLLADLLAFADRTHGDAHPTTADTLAAIARHEAALGAAGDPKVRAAAARRAVWGHVRRSAPPGLVATLDVGFEVDGTIHLVPHLSRDPAPVEAARLEAILVAAVDDLCARAGNFAASGYD